MGRGRATTTVAGWCLAVAALVALGGCSRPTPGCDRAAADLAAAHLDAAAEAYAAAADEGEGDCAGAGLNTVGARFVTAYQNVARGRAAEVGHDRDAAATAYRAALGDDTDNAAARAGLTRLGQAAPAAAPPTAAPPTTPPLSPAPSATAPAPTAAPSSPGQSGLVIGLLVAVLALLGAAVVALAALLSMRRGTADSLDARLDERLDVVRHRIEEILRADAEQKPERAVELRALRQDLGAQTVRIEEILRADAQRRPGWAADHLDELKALQQNLEAQAVRLEEILRADARPVVDEHSRRLRGDLTELVAFLDHRLPGRGLTHDRFGASLVDTEQPT